MYRRYYSYSDMPQLIKKDGAKELPPRESKPEAPPPADDGNGKIFGKFNTDDIILAIVIVALLTDGGDNDGVLLAALAVIFLAGIA